MSDEAPNGFTREQGPGGLEARLAPVEVRAADDDDLGIQGFGSVADQTTTIEGMFTDWDEEVAAGAWTKTIREADVRSMFNHDTNQLLGRTSAGTLRLTEPGGALWYDVDINRDDPMAVGVHAKVARGDVDGSSVWFRVVRQEWTYPSEQNDLERPLRRILEAQLFEVGPVTFPAFKQTTSQARSLSAVDSVLRSAGLTSAAKRARLGDRLAAGEDLEAELRHLFSSAPDLRDAVCSCRVADDPEPARAAEPSPDRTLTQLSVARRRLLLRRLPAAVMAPDIPTITKPQEGQES